MHAFILGALGRDSKGNVVLISQRLSTSSLLVLANKAMLVIFFESKCLFDPGFCFSVQPLDAEFAFGHDCASSAADPNALLSEARGSAAACFAGVSLPRSIASAPLSTVSGDGDVRFGGLFAKHENLWIFQEKAACLGCVQGVIPNQQFTDLSSYHLSDHRLCQSCKCKFAVSYCKPVTEQPALAYQWHSSWLICWA